MEKWIQIIKCVLFDNWNQIMIGLNFSICWLCTCFHVSDKIILVLKIHKIEKKTSILHQIKKKNS